VKRLKKKLLDPNRKTRYKILAKQFGVSEMQLHRIKTGENWGHIIV
jgi:DNA-binding Xre family transcriptional regulator